MNKNISRFSLFFVLTLAFTSISAMAQATSTTTVEKIPFSLTFPACNGEDVTIEGISTLLIHMTVSVNGRINFKIGNTQHATGIGQITGAKYVGSSTQQINEHFDSIDFAPFNSTMTSHLNFNGQGGVENLRIKELYHATVNANGELTKFKLEMSSECN